MWQVGLGDADCLGGAWNSPEFDHTTEWQSLPDGVLADQVVVHAHSLRRADESCQLPVSSTTVETEESGCIGTLHLVLGDVNLWSKGDVWSLQ